MSPAGRGVSEPYGHKRRLQLELLQKPRNCAELAEACRDGSGRVARDMWLLIRKGLVVNLSPSCGRGSLALYALTDARRRKLTQLNFDAKIAGAAP